MPDRLPFFNTMKKPLIFLLLAFLSLACLTAQQADTYTIFSLDIGYNTIFDPDPDPGDDSLYFFPSLGVNLRMSDRFSGGVEFNHITINSGLMGPIPLFINVVKLKVDAAPIVRAVFGYSSSQYFLDSSAGAVDLGLEIIPYRQRTGGLNTELKFVFECLFDPSDPANYNLRFGINAGIGH